MDSPQQWLEQNSIFQPSTLIPSILLVILLTYLSYKKFDTRNVKLPPNPPKLPIIGNLHQLSKHPHLSLHSLSKKYGPIFHLQLGEIPTVIVSSAEMAKQVLKTHDLSLANRPQIFGAKHLFYNCTDMAFAPYGAYWRHVRKICIFEILSAKRVQSYEFVREQEVAKLIHRIGESSHPRTSNLSKLLNMYANDVLCRVVFGKDFSAGGEYERLGFQEMLEEYQELLGGFEVGDFFPSMEFVHTLTGNKSRLLRAFRRFDEFFDGVIADHLKSNNKRDHKDFVDILLEVQKDDIQYGEIPLTLDNVKAILLDGLKMGKSLGNTLEPTDLVHRFGPDAVRYFFLKEVEFGSDGDYSEDRFINIINAHLANTIGNLLNRTLGLLKKNCQSTFSVDSVVAAEGNMFKNTVERLVEKSRMHYENVELSSACEAVLEIGNAGNVYIDEKAPWSLFKQGGLAFETATKDLVIVLEAIRIIAIVLSPVTPSLSSRIYTQLGFSEDQFNGVTWNDTRWGGLKQGHVTAQPKPVFARIELPMEENSVGGEFEKANQKMERQKTRKVVEA